MDDYEQQDYTSSEIYSIYTNQKFNSENRNETLELENENEEENSKNSNENNVPILKRTESKKQSFFKDCFTEKRMSTLDNEYDEILDCKKLKDV